MPIIRDINCREKDSTQNNITRFFKGSVGAEAFTLKIKEGGGKSRRGKPVGKRLEKALKRLKKREGAGAGVIENKLNSNNRVGNSTK